MQDQQAPSDAELVALARKGSQAAYQTLLQRYERPVFGLVVRMVRDAGLAEDISQEAFLKAFSALGKYDPGRRFSSWLFKIAHNATIDHLRRKKLPTTPLESGSEEGLSLLDRLDDDGATSPEVRIKRLEIGEALEAALLELRPDYREVVVMRFLQEMSYQEISEILELPLGTVKTNLHRARKELARLLDGWTGASRG